MLDFHPDVGRRVGFRAREHTHHDPLSPGRPLPVAGILRTPPPGPLTGFLAAVLIPGTRLAGVVRVLQSPATVTGAAAGLAALGGGTVSLAACVLRPGHEPAAAAVALVGAASSIGHLHALLPERACVAMAAVQARSGRYLALILVPPQGEDETKPGREEGIKRRPEGNHGKKGEARQRT